MRLPDKRILLEQAALLFASMIWTIVVVTAIALYWAYQDIQARWELVMSLPPEALAQAQIQATPPTTTPSPTATLWPGPGPTLTPSATSPPTPTATWVIGPPNILPETLNPDDPTPIPVIIDTEEEIAALDLALEQAVSTPGPPTPTLEPTPTPPPSLDQNLVPTRPPPTQAPPPTVTPAPPPAAAAGLPEPGNAPGAPTRLVIESVGIDSQVIPVGWRVIEQNRQQYSIWEVADYAVGWHQTSALLGQPGNTVMAGHHNVNGEVFRDLVNIEVGDKVAVYAGGQRFEYRVELKTIVKEKGEPIEVRQRNAEWIASTDDERLTLVTCWPYTNNTHRVIVVARRL